MKYFLILLLVSTGIIFSLLTFAKPSIKISNSKPELQIDGNHDKEHRHHWELLILIGVIGIIGFKNHTSIGPKLKSADSPVDIQKKHMSN